MRSVYLISDFSYNPLSKKPLIIFEIADAFASDFSQNQLERSKLTPRELFYNDLAMSYPDALLISPYPNGVNLLNLSDKSETMSYDKDSMFDNSVNTRTPSLHIIQSLLEELLNHAGKRQKNSKPLVLNLGHPEYFGKLEVPESLNDSSTVKIVNQVSREFHKALFNKEVFHKHANGSPIYPTSLLIHFNNKDDLDAKIASFMVLEIAEYYVLKPTDGTHSEHVHVVNAKDLIKTLKQIKEKSYIPEASERYHRSGLLVQVCHPSKSLLLDGKEIYAKGRAIIRADFNNEDATPSLHYIAGYWQMANRPHENEINDQTVIANIPANPEGSLEIEQHDWEEIKKLFDKSLPKILATLDRKIDSHSLDFLSSRKITQSPSEQLSLSLIDFFNKQFLVPDWPELLRKAYFKWNTHVESSNQALLIKETVVDFLGLDKATKNSLSYNSQVTHEFIKQAAEHLFTNPEVVFIQKNSIRNQSYYYAKSFLLHSIVITTVDVLISQCTNKEEPLSTSFMLGALGATLTQLIKTFTPSHQASSFWLFKDRTSKKITAKEEEPGLADHTYQRFDYKNR